jgi:hypothetical protein
MACAVKAQEHLPSLIHATFLRINNVQLLLWIAAIQASCHRTFQTIIQSSHWGSYAAGWDLGLQFLVQSSKTRRIPQYAPWMADMLLFDLAKYCVH